MTDPLPKLFAGKNPIAVRLFDSQLQMSLEKVIGTTSQNQNSLVVNPANGDLCYLAGCYIVVYN